MFRHRDKGRTYSHNLYLAALLSTVAGIVNIAGVLSLKTLTTNVTGHFAFFSEGLILKDYGLAVTSIIYVLCFLAGAFVASTSMEIISKDKTHFSYMLPISLEIASLLFVVLSGLAGGSAVIMVCTLLFAMGIQNALVTRISGSVVRTTHLTGLFTDLGIELSQMIFYNKTLEQKKLRKSIYLKVIIISGFFIGGIAGALLHLVLDIRTLFIPIGILLFALYYDRVRLSFYHLRRKMRDFSHHHHS